MKKQNRLRDILIDHVFDYCNNEVVNKIESPGITILFDNAKDLEDPFTKHLVEKAIESGDMKNYFGVRNSEFCKILVGKSVHQSLMQKLEILGFRKSNRLSKEIHRAEENLVARSYLVRNKPVENEVRLTEKGLKHYLDGRSFENSFLSRRNSIIAIVISVTSAIISIISMVWNKA